MPATSRCPQGRSASQVFVVVNHAVAVGVGSSVAVRIEHGKESAAPLVVERTAVVDPIGDELDVSRVRLGGAERGHAAEAVGAGHAVEDDAVGGVAGDNVFVEGAAAAVDGVTVDEAGVFER